MADLQGKVAIVTGSTSGIGRETALHFSRLGVNVIVNGRRSELVEQVTKECERVSPNGIKCVGVVADVTIAEQAKRIIDTA
ncbi:putative oxidoreductase YhdF-like protein, partial [Leptotrombidium deliense]